MGKSDHLQQNEIWTIGHSTRSMEELIEMLQSFHIEVLADVRSYPGSRRYPHFNKAALEETMPKHQIQYLHFKDLGGRRKASKESKNTGWRLASFRAYADYMETREFLDALQYLEELGREKRVAYMCAEAVWWSCHRSLISDCLKVKNWKVMHIMAKGRADEHPYTKPARIENGKLLYSG